MFIFFAPSIIGFKSPATPIMEGIIDLHNYIFFYLILIFIVVFWMYCYILYTFYVVPTYFYDFSLLKNTNTKFFYYLKQLLLFLGLERKFYISLMESNNINEIEIGGDYLLEIYQKYLNHQARERHVDILETRKITEHTLIEIIWTIIPSIILVLIAIPSFALLYAMDEVIDPKLTVKAVGYQWFWSYEYAHSFDVIEFNYLTDSFGYNNRYYRKQLIYDSVMLTEDELQFGFHRLLDVDRQLILPVKTHIRLMITGADVIHSWAVPSFGIKVDAIPGRMSQIGVFIKYEGVFYGQCSELRGVNHGFMPIAVKVVGYDTFMKWYRKVDVVWNT